MGFNNEDIERYLRRETDEATNAGIERKMKEDEDFAEAVEQQRLILEGIQFQSWKRMVAGVEKELEAEGFFHDGQAVPAAGLASAPRIITWRWALAAAAALLFFLTGIWLFFLRPSSGSQVFAEFFRPFPDQVSAAVEAAIDKRGFLKTEEKLAALSHGLVAYQEGGYSRAIDSIGAYLEIHPRGVFADEACFYQAVSYLAQGDAQTAAVLLAPLAGEDNSEWAIPARWYLALAYVKAGDASKARPVLEELARQRPYAGQAKELLKRF